MVHYYVNDTAQRTGEHEVHTNTCAYYSIIQRKTYLGFFSTCKEAMAEARKKYDDVDGCASCCPACHTK